MTNENIELKLAQLTEPLNIDELTTGAVDGTGVFDVLMRVGKAHIKEEFDKQRITGKEYSTAYLGMMQSTQANAIDYLLKNKTIGAEILNLEKDGEYKDAQIAIANQQLEKQPYEIKLLEAQTDQVKAQTTNVGATTDRITKETEQKLPAEVKMLTAQVTGIEAENELTGTKVLASKEELKQYPVQLEILGKQKDQLTAQTEGITLSNDKLTKEIEQKLPLEVKLLETQGKGAEAEVTFTNVKIQDATASLAKIPVEVDILKKQLLIADADNSLKLAQVDQLQKEVTKIPYEISILEKQAIQAEAQGLLTNAQKDQVLYETANKLPVEVTNLQKQSDQLDAQLEMTEAQVTKILEENKIIPYQISKLQAEIANMTRQSDILEKELEIKVLGIALQDKQILLATAELDIRKQELEVKKAEVESTKAQADLYAAKVLTENAQTQPTAAVGSVLGANVAVLNAQAEGYARDAEQKLTKILVDTWNVRRNTDELTDANATNRLSDANIGTAIQALFKGVGITSI